MVPNFWRKKGNELDRGRLQRENCGRLRGWRIEYCQLLYQLQIVHTIFCTYLFLIRTEIVSLVGCLIYSIVVVE